MILTEWYASQNPLGGSFLGIPLLQILLGITIGIWNTETTKELYRGSRSQKQEAKIRLRISWGWGGWLVAGSGSRAGLRLDPGLQEPGRAE